MSKNQFGNMAMMLVLSVMSGMKNSVYNYTGNRSGNCWKNTIFDMNEIGKAKKKNRQMKRRK